MNSAAIKNLYKQRLAELWNKISVNYDQAASMLLPTDIKTKTNIMKIIDEIIKINKLMKTNNLPLHQDEQIKIGQDYDKIKILTSYLEIPLCLPNFDKSCEQLKQLTSQRDRIRRKIWINACYVGTGIIENDRKDEIFQWIAELKRIERESRQYGVDPDEKYGEYEQQCDLLMKHFQLSHPAKSYDARDDHGVDLPSSVSNINEKRWENKNQQQKQPANNQNKTNEIETNSENYQENQILNDNEINNHNGKDNIENNQLILSTDQNQIDDFNSNNDYNEKFDESNETHDQDSNDEIDDNDDQNMNDDRPNLMNDVGDDGNDLPSSNTNSSEMAKNCFM